MSPRNLARIAAVIGGLEGTAWVRGQMRIPAQLVVSTNATDTAANILSNESLFRLGLLLGFLAVAFNIARMGLFYVLFRPAGRTAALVMAFFAILAVGLQAASLLFQVPILLILKNGSDFGALNAQQLQSLALIFLRWGGQASNVYLAFFGLWCVLVGYLIHKSTFLPRILGILMALAGLGYATYLRPPLANYLYPYNLALGVGELALWLWLLILGVNPERWKEQANATSTAS